MFTKKKGKHLQTHLFFWKGNLQIPPVFRGINGRMFIPFHIESSPVHSITQLTAPTHHALVDLGDPVCTSQWRPGRLADVLEPTKSTSGVFRSHIPRIYVTSWWLNQNHPFEKICYSSQNGFKIFPQFSWVKIPKNI